MQHETKGNIHIYEKNFTNPSEHCRNLLWIVWKCVLRNGAALIVVEPSAKLIKPTEARN